ncbi:MAG: hypothetical protein J6S83_13455 [Lachnospiraceae bacterium]|nr:hypothetical protein [Lachnospiraceae bacterium]
MTITRSDRLVRAEQRLQHEIELAAEAVERLAGITDPHVQAILTDYLLMVNHIRTEIYMIHAEMDRGKGAAEDDLQGVCVLSSEKDA